MKLATGDFGQLRAFAAVAESLSFTRAAEMLGVSPSALSQLVRGLETHVGKTLLNRTTRSVSLTQTGMALFERVRPAIVELEGALAGARHSSDRPSGTVRLHAFRRGAELYVVPIFRAFAEEFPDIVLDLTLDDAPVDIVAGGYDAAIRIGEVIERDMTFIRLGPDMRQVVVASPSYLSRHSAPTSPHELYGHACIRWRWDGRMIPQPWEFHEGRRRFKIVVDGPLIVNSREVEQEAAIDGVGLAYLVKERIEEHLKSGTLVALLERWSAPFPGYFLCYPKQATISPALRALLGHFNSDHAAKIHASMNRPPTF